MSDLQSKWFVARSWLLKTAKSAAGSQPRLWSKRPCSIQAILLQGFSLNKLQHLVLDEADRLLNMDFEQEIDQILKVLPKERRTQLFSATMTSKVAKLQRACLVDPVKVEVATKYQTVETLRQQYLFIPAKYKVPLLPHRTAYPPIPLYRSLTLWNWICFTAWPPMQLTGMPCCIEPCSCDGDACLME